MSDEPVIVNPSKSDAFVLAIKSLSVQFAGLELAVVLPGVLGLWAAGQINAVAAAIIIAGFSLLKTGLSFVPQSGVAKYDPSKFDLIPKVTNATSAEPNK